MANRRAELAARRIVMGFTQESLAERLGIDQTTVRRWELGHRTPGPAIRSSLAEALEVSHRELADLLSLPRDDREGLPAILDTRHLHSLDDSDLARRAASSMGLGTAAPVVTGIPGARTADGSLSVDRLVCRTHAMRPLLYSSRGSDVLRVVTQLLDVGDELLWRLGGSEQKRALATYSELSLMAGRLLFFDVSSDGSRDREARCHFREAAAAALAAGDRALEAAAIGHLAFVTARRGHAARALEDLHFADALAGRTDVPRLRAWLAAVESELLAGRDAVASLRALDRAEEHRASTRAGGDGAARADHPGWLDYVSEGQLDSFRGYALMEAGRTVEAREALESALEFYARHRNPKQRAVVMLDLATAHLYGRDEDVDTACATALDAMEGIEPLGYAVAPMRLRRFVHALAGRGATAGVRDLRLRLGERLAPPT